MIASIKTFCGLIPPCDKLYPKKLILALPKTHLLFFNAMFAIFNRLNTTSTFETCCLKHLLNMTISSIYANTRFGGNPAKVIVTSCFTFAEYLGFKHRKITPAWPKANSLSENFNSCLKKVLQTSRIQRLNWQQELNKFLRNYRATPHATTGRSPAEQFKTRLPGLPKPYDDDGVRKRDKFARSRMKHYADNKMTVRETQFNIGDRVLVKQKEKDKLTAPFCPDPYTFVKKKSIHDNCKK